MMKEIQYSYAVLSKCFFAFLLVCTMSFYSCENAYKVSSPDGTIVVQTVCEKGKLYYNVSKNNKPVVDASALGFALKGDSLYSGLKLTGVKYAEVNEDWEQLWGEERMVNNHYKEMTISVMQDGVKSRKFDLVFRVFNDGFGFRYEFPEQENMKEFVIMDELTEFALIENSTAWTIPAWTPFYEALYQPALVSNLDTVCTPATIETPSGLFLAIHEANLTDYAAMNLTPIGETSKLKVELTPWSTGEKVFMNAPAKTPWRTMIIADNAGDLLLSRLMLNLNEPCQIEDTAWIQPARYIGIWWAIHMGKYTWKQGPIHGATTANTKRYIDFAAKNGFSGVLVEGWNKGWDGDWTADGHLFSFTEAYPDFNLPEITDYAAKKGVKLIGHHETGGAAINYEAQLDSAFALCQRHGINVVKTGYVNKYLDNKELHDSQYGVRHYRKVVETAAKYGIMIDNHEPVMPTGLQRTWPNLMTQEGVRGQEYDAWSQDGGNPPNHTTIVPFTRGLAGPMDFTPATFNFENPIFPETRVQTTLAKQLALFLVLYSPLQMASDMIENYEGQPALEFITSCPVNWEKTLVLDAKIGAHLTIARKDRDSDNWYLGGITNENAISQSLPLNFLDEGVEYKAKIFKDGKQAHYLNNPYDIAIEELLVTNKSVLDLNLGEGGGVAISFTK